MGQTDNVEVIVFPENMVDTSVEEEDIPEITIMPDEQQQDIDDISSSEPSVPDNKSEDTDLTVEESNGTSTEDQTVTTSEIAVTLAQIEEYSKATCQFTIDIFFILLLVFGCFIMRFIYRIVTDTLRNM